LKKCLRYLQIARYLTLFFQCIEYVRSQRIFGGGVNAMMGAGFPVMAWGENDVLQEYWSMGCQEQNWSG